MSYKAFIYAITLVITAFALSGINFTDIFKKNHKLEANIFMILMIISISYLVSNFIISFLEFSGI